MLSKYKVALLWIMYLYFSCEMVMTGGQVVLVNRNVSDSFRVGEDGCTNDSSVCPSSSTCQPGSGLCLCGRKPNFLNSECVRNIEILFAAGVGLGVACYFEPFQLIPYSHKAAATQFRQENNMTSCSLNSKKKPQAKFPNITNSIDLQWLDDSYVKFSVSNNILNFTWAKSVPGLQGTIITLHLRCVEGESHPSYCLRAKVFGTWPSEPAPVTNPETTSVVNTKPPSTGITKPNSPTTRSETSDVRSSATNTKSPTSSAPSSSLGLISGESSEKEYSDVLIAVLAVSLVVNVVLGIVVVFLWNKRSRMQNNHLTEKEMKNIGEQEKESTENEITTYEDVETPGRIHNDGNYENPVLSSPQDNNAFSSDHQYEETTNYESLRRNPLQDQSDEHHYQSLTTTQGRK